MKTITISSFIIMSIVTMLSAQTNQTNCAHSENLTEDSLQISNDGIKWVYQQRWSLFLKPQIVGIKEQEIMQMVEPPSIDLLLESLSNTNKWESSHVLLTYRYLGEWSATIDEWNELNPKNDIDRFAEMQKIQNFWNKKKEDGKLNEVMPVLDSERLCKLFGTYDSAEEERKRREESEEKNRQWALDQFGAKTPPLNELIDALYQTNLWRAANVVLVVKFEPSKFTIDSGEGLFTTDQLEMQKCQKYWEEKLKMVE